MLGILEVVLFLRRADQALLRCSSAVARCRECAASCVWIQIVRVWWYVGVRVCRMVMGAGVEMKSSCGIECAVGEVLTLELVTFHMVNQYSVMTPVIT
jgi:hypothetical protein